MGGGMLTSCFGPTADQSPGVLVLSQDDESSPRDSDAVLAKDRLTRLGGRNVLRLTQNPATETLYGQIAHRLAA
jgi:hypothetical protein